MLSDLNSEIVSAIQKDRLVEYLASRSESEFENEKALRLANTCVQNIGLLARNEATSIEELLLDRNIGVVVRKRELKQQRPHVDIEIDLVKLEESLSVLSGIGYQPWENWTSGAWASFKQSRTSIPLTKTGGEGVQLTLHWSPTILQRLPEVLRPNETDWSGRILSDKLWFLYYPLVLKRLLGRVVKGKTTSRNLGPHLPTPLELVEPLLRKAGIDSDDLLLDVGSGDGSVSIAASKTVGCRGLGVELDADLVKSAIERTRREGLSESLKFVNADIVDVDISTCTAAFVFLPVAVLGEIIDFLKGGLPMGSTIIAHEQHALPESIKPDKVIPVFSERSLTIAHVWKV